MQRLLEGNAQLMEEALTQIKALPQPREDAEQLEAMYAQVEDPTALGRQGAAAAAQGDEAAFTAAADQADDLSTEVNDRFTEYGLTTCGEG